MDDNEIGREEGLLPAMAVAPPPLRKYGESVSPTAPGKGEGMCLCEDLRCIIIMDHNLLKDCVHCLTQESQKIGYSPKLESG